MAGMTLGNKAGSIYLSQEEMWLLGLQDFLVLHCLLHVKRDTSRLLPCCSLKLREEVQDLCCQEATV